MGNVLLDEYKKDDPVSIYERWLEQNPDLMGRQVLSDNKLFRTSSFQYSRRQVLIKVFFKRDNTSIQEYLKSFQVLNFLVEKTRSSNILPMRIIEMKDYKDKELLRIQNNIVMATRQMTQQTLEDRICRRPYCEEFQKKWLIFQMLLGVWTVHEKFNLYHGNIRTSNFLLTNYQYLLLTDFATYKPNYILQDTEQGLAEFRLFYASSLEKCNLAPQKMAGKNNLPSQLINSKRLFSLYNQNNIEYNKDIGSTHQSFIQQDSTKIGLKPVLKEIRSEEQYDYSREIERLQKMDLYSLGLSILQVLNDGRSSVTYEQLLKRNKDNTELSNKINQACANLKSGGAQMNTLLKGLLQSKGTDRTPIGQALQAYNSIINQDIYMLVWCCLSSFNKTSFSGSDLRICLIHSVIEFIQEEIKQSNYKFVMKKPKCLEEFKALRIFVQLIKKKLILCLPIEGESVLGRLISYVQGYDSGKNEVESEEQLISDDKDQRQSFFIHPLKHKQIAKRLSSVSESSMKTKEKSLCPMKYDNGVSLLFESKYKGKKLTSEQSRANRFQNLLTEFKKNQWLRQQKISQKVSYYQDTFLLIKIIFSLTRSCKYTATRMLAIQMITLLAKQSSDDVILKAVIPCLLATIRSSELSCAKYALNSLINTFYIFIDPFHSEQDTLYFDQIMQQFINLVRQPRLRLALFQRFKQIYLICEWLQIHYRRFNKKTQQLTKLIRNLRQYFGSYSDDQVRCLMQNIPQCLLPQLFEYYIHYHNSQKIDALRCSSVIAKHIAPQLHKNFLDVFDSCVESGLEEYGIGLFHSIMYFTVRKCTAQSIVKKIAIHVINPNKWVRDQAFNFVSMCVNQYPPTKNFFLFREIFDPPFPLKPDDLQDEVLLPTALKDSDIDIRQVRLSSNIPKGITEKLFEEYLQRMRQTKPNKKCLSNKVQQWSTAVCELKDVMHFRNYIKKQIELLYEYNFFYYFWNMKNKAGAGQRQKGYPQLNEAFKKSSRFSLDSSVNHQKKELFEYLLGIININGEKLLTKFSTETPCDRLLLAQAISLIGQVLYKFEQFKIKPIANLGEYTRKPTEFQKLPRPKGILVSQIYQHRDIISSLEKVADNFFLSGSYDGTLRIFNAKKIEMNVTTCSEASIDVQAGRGKARISSICSFDRTYTAVVGTNKGQIKIYQLERMPSTLPERLPDTRARDHLRDSVVGQKNNMDSLQILKYNVGGQVQKVLTIANELQNQCFCYITAEGILGVQDIRLKAKPLLCNLGKQRGIPRCLAATQNYSLLVGTIDGYLLTYDIRCNIISNILQLYNDKQPVPITSIIASPILADDHKQLFTLTYPSRNYAYSNFNLQQDRTSFPPQRHYTTASQDQILTTPYLVNRTNDQQFKLCNNNLMQRRYYDQLADFNKNFNIFDYLSDPLTRKQAKIREIWMDGCKNRLSQISSLFNKKSLPFLQFLNGGTLTNFNPCASARGKKNGDTLALLVERRENRDYNSIEKPFTLKPNTFKIYTIPEQQSSQHLTCCKVLPNFVIAGTRNSLLKVYK